MSTRANTRFCSTVSWPSSCCPSWPLGPRTISSTESWSNIAKSLWNWSTFSPLHHFWLIAWNFWQLPQSWLNWNSAIWPSFKNWPFLAQFVHFVNLVMIGSLVGKIFQKFVVGWQNLAILALLDHWPNLPSFEQFGQIWPIFPIFVRFGPILPFPWPSFPSSPPRLAGHVPLLPPLPLLRPPSLVPIRFRSASSSPHLCLSPLPIRLFLLLHPSHLLAQSPRGM